MATQTRADIAELYAVPEHGKAELVNGELVLMSPTGGLPGYAGGETFASLRAYAKQTQRGHAFPDNVGFIVSLPNRRSFSPDAAFYTGPIPSGGQFLRGAPVFAVEVRSENDYGAVAEQEMVAKRADYLAAGTIVVWDVDVLREKVVRSYSASDPNNPQTFHRGEAADAEPALPGWSTPVDDLFL